MQLSGGIVLGGLTLGALSSVAILQAPSGSEGISLPSRTAEFFVNFPGPPVGGTGFYAKGDGSVGTFRNILDDGTGAIKAGGAITSVASGSIGSNQAVLKAGSSGALAVGTDGGGRLQLDGAGTFGGVTTAHSVLDDGSGAAAFGGLVDISAGGLKFGTGALGGGTAELGSSCPATSPSSPVTWLRVQLQDGSTAYLPAWK